MNNNNNVSRRSSMLDGLACPIVFTTTTIHTLLYTASGTSAPSKTRLAAVAVKEMLALQQEARLLNPSGNQPKWSAVFRYHIVKAQHVQHNNSNTGINTHTVHTGWIMLPWLFS